MIYTFLGFVDFLKGAGDLILNLLIFGVVLGVIVGIHEAGHFFFARRGGILCREYAIGMGPVLWKKKKGETMYSLRAIPLGGFCAIAGEELEEDPFKDLEKIRLEIVDGVIKGFYLYTDEATSVYPEYRIKEYDIFDAEQTGNLYMNVETEDGEALSFTVDSKAMLYFTKKQELQIAPYNRTLGSKSKRRRALVMFGGPLMNFVLALIVFFIVGLCTGFTNYDSNVVKEVQKGSSIYDAGLRAGYKITAFETDTLGLRTIENWKELSSFMDEYQEKNLLDEGIKVTFEDKKGNSYTKEVAPFVALHNLGIGSTYEYLNTGKITIGIIDGLDTSFGDNSKLKLHDEIIRIKDASGKVVEVNSWKDVVGVVGNFDGKGKLEFTVNRNVEEDETKDPKYEELTVEVKPYSKELMDSQTSISGDKVPTVSVVLGIGASTKFSFIKSIGYSFRRTGESFMAVFNTLKMLFNKTVSVKNLSGPIGIFQLTSQVREAGGFLYILSLIGLLSVNIGLLNLFPIPALDGGRLVFVAYEAVTGKKPNPKVETILITVTMILLLGLMVFVAFADISRLFK